MTASLLQLLSAGLRCLCLNHYFDQQMCLIQISSLTQVKVLIIFGTYIICPHRDWCLHRSNIHKHATQVQARLVEAIESGFISSGTLTLCHWAVKNLSTTSNHLHPSFQRCHFVYYDVSLTFKPLHYLKYSPKMQMGYV